MTKKAILGCLRDKGAFHAQWMKCGRCGCDVSVSRDGVKAVTDMNAMACCLSCVMASATADDLKKSQGFMPDGTSRPVDEALAAWRGHLGGVNVKIKSENT